MLDALAFLLALLDFASLWRFWAAVGIAALPLWVWNVVVPRSAMSWWACASIIAIGAVAGGIWQARHERRVRRASSA
jgi:hypothetical protein